MPRLNVSVWGDPQFIERAQGGSVMALPWAFPVWVGPSSLQRYLLQEDDELRRAGWARSQVSGLRLVGFVHRCLPGLV